MHRKNPNRKFSLRFGKEEMSTEDKKPCLQGFVPSWSFLTRLRRPLLFRLAGKEGGEKGRWVTVLCILPLNSSGPQCFGLAFHSIVTSCVSDYAPPDTGGIRFAAGCRRTIAVNRRNGGNPDGCYLLAGKILFAGTKAFPYEGKVARRNAETERSFRICDNLSVSLRLPAPLQGEP